VVVKHFTSKRANIIAAADVSTRSDVLKCAAGLLQTMKVYVNILGIYQQKPKNNLLLTLMENKLSLNIISTFNSSIVDRHQWCV